MKDVNEDASASPRRNDSETAESPHPDGFINTPSRWVYEYTSRWVYESPVAPPRCVYEYHQVKDQHQTPPFNSP